MTVILISDCSLCEYLSTPKSPSKSPRLSGLARGCNYGSEICFLLHRIFISHSSIRVSLSANKKSSKSLQLQRVARRCKSEPTSISFLVPVMFISHCSIRVYLSANKKSSKSLRLRLVVRRDQGSAVEGGRTFTWRSPHQRRDATVIYFLWQIFRYGLKKKRKSAIFPKVKAVLGFPHTLTVKKVQADSPTIWESFRRFPACLHQTRSLLLWVLLRTTNAAIS